MTAISIGLSAGCTSDPAARQPSTTISEAPTREAPTRESPAPTAPSRQDRPPAKPDPLEPVVAGSRRVEFRTMDGVRLDGRVFGSGHFGIVLSHMGRESDDQSDWYRTAAMLADHGYRVLTYNRRGVCPGRLRGCSGGVDSLGEHWKDVVGAYEYLRGHGARHVVVGGASIGAMATFYAVQRTDIDPAGVIWIAGVASSSEYTFTGKTVSQLTVPKLLVSGDQDTYGAAEDTARLAKWAAGPKTLLIVHSSWHGTDMLQPDRPRAVRKLIESALLSFLRDVAATAGRGAQ